MKTLVACFLCMFILFLFFGFYIKQYLNKRRIGKESKEKIEEYLNNNFYSEKESCVNIFLRTIKRKIRLMFKKVYFNYVFYILETKTEDFKRTILVLAILVVLCIVGVFYGYFTQSLISVMCVVVLLIILLLFKFMAFEQIFPNKQDILDFFGNKYKNNEIIDENLKFKLLNFNIGERYIKYWEAAFFNPNYDDDRYVFYSGGKESIDRKIMLKAILELTYIQFNIEHNVLVKAFKDLQVDLQIVGGMIEIEENKITFSLNRLKGNEKKSFVLLCEFVDVCFMFINQINNNGKKYKTS